MILAHGAVDFEAVLFQSGTEEIEMTGYDGWITVEQSPYIDKPADAARETREYLTAAMHDVGITVE